MKNSKQTLLDEYSNAISGNKKGAVYATGKAKFAGYTPDELNNLPDNIANESFGCGNPLAFSQVKKGQTILDLGCGAGLDLLLAAVVVGHNGKVIGVDMNQDMLDKALFNIKASGHKNIEVIKGTIEDLPLTDSSVDWVISNCVINLSSDKPQAFAEINRVLKPKGQMLVSDIVAQKVPWWVKKSGVLHAACGGGVISEKDYLQGLQEAGLSNCKVVARQYYEASQLTPIIVATLPKFITKISCCGKSIATRIVKRLVTPIAKNLWSAKISATR